MGASWFPSNELYPNYSYGSHDYDYIGFSFNGIHSNSFNIVRINDGSGFDENLLPSFLDTVLNKEGQDGTYYFGSQIQKREINISFAFDNLTEINLRNMKSWLSNRNLSKLIFDENPYKVYYAKISSIPSIHFVCFDNENVDNTRIYKGDGTISFVAYEAYAVLPYINSTINLSSGIAQYKNYKRYLDDYNYVDYVTKHQWGPASGLRENRLIDLSNGIIYDMLRYDGMNLCWYMDVYNAGDISTPFKVYLGFQGNGCPLTKIELVDDTYLISLAEMSFNFANCHTSDAGTLNDDYMVINTKTQLIEGFNDNFTRTGNLYNLYKNSGNWFNLPVGHSILKFTGLPASTQNIVGIVEYTPQYF